MKSESDLKTVRDFMSQIGDMEGFQQTQTDREVVGILNWVLEEDNEVEE